MNLLSIFALAMTPVGELRVAIPYGIGLHELDWYIVYLISIAGNLIPPLFILIFFDKLPFLKRWSIFSLSEKKKKWITQYGWIGLFFLVAIPLPGTGAWTGSLLSWMLKLPKIPALLTIFMGICCAGVVVTMASMGIIHLIGFPVR